MKKLGFLIVILSGISIYAFILPKDKASPIEQTKAIARADFESCFAHHFCGGSLFSFLRSASRICLPAPTRRAIAWPIDPAPIRPDIAGVPTTLNLSSNRFSRESILPFSHLNISFDNCSTAVSNGVFQKLQVFWGTIN